MAFKVESGSFVQILYNGYGHWLAITNIGAEGEDEVLVYDSLYPSVSTCVHKQIAALLHTNNREIRVKIVDMQIQAGTCDYGLFAIATATALLSGVEPGACTFKQTEMRKHLYDGFKRGKILPFPLLKKRCAGRKVKHTETISVYCLCRMPEAQDQDMVECSNCLEWYHIDCVIEPVPTAALDNSNVDWFVVFINSYFLFCIYPVLHFYQYNKFKVELNTLYNILTSYLLIGMWGVQKCHEGSFYFNKICSWGSIFFCKFWTGGPNLGGSKSLMTGPYFSFSIGTYL